MAIDRTGISSLNAGAPDLRLEGDIASIQAIPIEIQKMILQYQTIFLSFSIEFCNRLTNIIHVTITDKYIHW